MPAPTSRRAERDRAVARARALAARQLSAPPVRDDVLTGGAADPGGPEGDTRPRHRAGLGPLGEELRQRVADRLPPGLRAVRWRVSRPAVAGALALALLVVAATAWWTWQRWPEPGAAPGAVAGEAVPARTAVAVPETVAPAADPGAAQGEPPVAGEPAAAPTGVVVVHVAGRVAAPGVVTLAAGSRVADALAAAGGAAADADLDRLNLARPLVDGEQVLVPAPGEVLPPAPGAPAATAAGAAPAAVGGPLDLNTATEADLDDLPGVGEVLAGRIVAWRQEHGRFTSVDELAEVHGIGPKVLDGLRDLVTA
ncbi:ComEA family DNA-binding protein [Kineococcus sp. SYSU DK004]|uniref:ComEA family DNA-binding protein n=1 Tax=Kineococcus sp. SYSU DK004 TaxID=3383125 RepID=UPI003D7EBB43